MNFSRIASALLSAVGLLAVVSSGLPADIKPLRVLLVTGGAAMITAGKGYSQAGIEERANAEVVQIHTTDTSTKPVSTFMKWRTGPGI
jgi:hypothetical protein